MNGYGEAINVKNCRIKSVHRIIFLTKLLSIIWRTTLKSISSKISGCSLSRIISKTSKTNSKTNGKTKGNSLSRILLSRQLLKKPSLNRNLVQNLVRR
jgi:hypothetical protein